MCQIFPMATTNLTVFRKVKRYSLLQCVMFTFSFVLLTVLYLLAALKHEISLQ